MTTYKINIDMDRKCKRCHKGGACENGYCLSCVTKMIGEGKFDHILFKKRPQEKREG